MHQELISRPLYLNKLKSLSNNNIVKIITGARRCGKSTILELFQSYLMLERAIPEQNIISISFENLEQLSNIGLQYTEKNTLIGFKKLFDFVKNKINPEQQYYLFIDEIQLLEQWQIAINSLLTLGNIDIYLTGSNAYMFSSDLANSFGGRYIEIKTLPYSFAEYYHAYHEANKFRGDETREEYFNKYNPEYIFNKYITNGGFPFTVKFLDTRDGVNDYLHDTVYLNTIQKDIIVRYNISGSNKLDILSKFMFDNIGSETSIRNIEKCLKNENKSISSATISTYIQGLLDSYLLYKCDRYDIKGKQILTNTNSKYYIVDSGLRSAILGIDDMDKGRILENIVYLELLRRGYRVYTGKHTTKNNIEVDFVATKLGGIIEYYQVSWYAMQSEKTLARELASLNEIQDNYPKYLLSMDSGNGISNGIQRLNVVEWLLNYDTKQLD